MVYLSIVLPVRNEEQFIGATLSALAAQDYPWEKFELIVVDGRSTDSTRETVERFMAENPSVNVTLLDNPGKLSSAARTIGAKYAKGRVVAFVDGHVYIPSNMFFYTIQQLIEEKGAHCLARPQHLDVPGLQGMPYWIAVARKSWLGHSLKSYIYGIHEGFVDPTSSGFAYHRSVFEKVGYFDASFDAAEDVEFNYRVRKAGFDAYTSPDLLVYYYPRNTLAALFKQQVRYGEGRARFVRKHPKSFSLETLVPPMIFLLTVSMVPAIAVLPFLPAFAKIILVFFSSYLIMLLVTGLYEAFRRKAPLGTAAVAASLWTTHLGLGWGFLKEFFSRANDKN